MEKRFEKLIDFFTDPMTAEKLGGMKAEDAVVFLKENYDLEFSAEELRDFGDGMRAALEDSSDELPLDVLDQVAGGKENGNSVGYNIGYYGGKVIKAVVTIGKLISLFG